MKKVLFIGCVWVLFFSCATLFTGSRQSITFDAKMPEVGIYKHGVKLGETDKDSTFTTKIGKRSFFLCNRLLRSRISGRWVRK